MKRAKIANQSSILFKPMLDTRYHEQDIVSHDANSMKSIPVSYARDILTMVEGIQVVGIDEAQFFDAELPDICEALAHNGVRVIIAGLDMDFKGKPFGPMPHLLAIAEYITKVHAICQHCGNLATHSYRLIQEDQTVLLGEKEEYEARCRICYRRGQMLNLK
jgi:thymidine kinase